MTNSVFSVAAYLVLISGISIAGGVAPLVRTWSKGQLTLLVSAGAGVLLGAAFLHMMPIAADAIGHMAGFTILAGFLIIFILEKFVLVDSCEEVGCTIHRFGLAAFLGITFHSLLDGVAVGSSLIVPSLAVPIVTAIVVHKIPAAFSLCSILLLAGHSRKGAFLHILGFSISTPLGALLSYFFLNNLDPRFVGYAIGVSGGSFIAIATSDLLPQLHKAGVNRMATLLFLLLGIAVMVVTAVGAGNGHAHG